MRTSKRSPLTHLLCGLVIVAAAIAWTPTSSAAAKPPHYPQAGVLVTTTVAARARPEAAARMLAVFRQFRRDFRPTTLLVLGDRRTRSGRWLKVSVPGRPNGQVGWVRAAGVQTRPVRARIVVDLSARRLRVVEDGRIRFSTRVAIGKRGAETPVGRFYVTATFRPKETYLGSHAFETSAYSKLSDWPGGGIVGLHGTPQPQLLGRRVSHGCVRMSNAAALVLKRLAPAGTPLSIVG